MDEVTEQDIPELYPSLLSLGRPTTLLNWTPGEAAIRESSMGGHLLWPRSEPWPVCERRHGHLASTGFVEKDESNEPKAHLVALLQLRASDVPTIRFPEGMDLVQILWCPALHMEGGVPAPVIYWRDTAQVSDALDRHPPVRESQSEGRPFPCVPAPEALLDFPDPIDLPADAARQAFGDDDPEDEADTYAELVRDRWADKAGGYPYCPQELCQPCCPECSMEMSLLVQLFSQRLALGAAGSRVQFGRGERMAIFMCTTCPGTPTVHNVQ
jgi:hypothetical protein